MHLSNLLLYLACALAFMVISADAALLKSKISQSGPDYQLGGQYNPIPSVECKDTRNNNQFKVLMYHPDGKYYKQCYKSLAWLNMDGCGKDYQYIFVVTTVSTTTGPATMTEYPYVINGGKMYPTQRRPGFTSLSPYLQTNIKKCKI
ncbi:UNKNOWN [Stylonychia lemnae]|uniref:Uncharacterized protein n=1 Tax=Stylonychia lemnae TaxID=5949 RepID=A0A078ARN8_STYLE|nr:UNKNOWN [Stylonychia lemnae]|eukprot:CDW85145.1 UNKNOWN [Stylonychia lemnae]